MTADFAERFCPEVPPCVFECVHADDRRYPFVHIVRKTILDP